MQEENSQILFHKIARYFPESYRNIQPLAQGGMGWVYTADYQEQKVCLKIPAPTAGNKLPEWLMRFQVERDILFRLSHPRIVKALDQGEILYGDAILPFFSMEYCSNGTLRDLLNEYGRLEKHIALNIVLEIASALDHFHKTGCIYRDLKPENILFDKKNLPKIGDFGTIKHPDIFLTKRGDIIGSFYYCSPEQLLNQPLNQSVDVFALGLILFEMITGRKIGNQIIESWKKQQALMDLESDTMLWELCSAMLADKNHRLKSMSAVMEKIYDSHGSQKKIKCFSYYLKDWWHGKSLQKTSKYRSEVVSVLNNIIELVETYSIADVMSEITRKLKPFPIHLIANEIPGFLSDVCYDTNIKLAKVMGSIRNKSWLCYLIHHLVINSSHDNTAIFLMNLLIENQHDQNLKKEIFQAFYQIWSAVEIQKVDTLLEKAIWDSRNLFFEQGNEPLFPIIVNKLQKTKDINTTYVCLEILSAMPQFYDVAMDIFIAHFTSKHPGIRKFCFVAMSEMFVQSKEIFQYLCSGMADPCEQVRTTCAVGLGKNKPNIFSASVLVTGLFDLSFSVRAACAESLGKAIGFEKDVIPNLVEKLKDKHETVRFNAAKSLQKLSWTPNTITEKLWFSAAKQEWQILLSYPEQIVDIIACVLKSSSFKIRLAGLKIIEELKLCPNKILTLLVRGLKNEQSKKYRTACANTLEIISWHPNTRENYAWLLAEKNEWSCLHLLGENSIPAIYQNLKDGDKKTQLYALKELKKVKKADKKTLCLLLHCDSKQKCRELILAYADCLMKMETVCEKEIIEAFFANNFRDNYAELFWGKVLKKLSSNTLEAMLPRLQETAVNVQIVYIKAIRKKNIVSATLFLLRGLENKYFHYRLECLKALSLKMTQNDVMPCVISLLYGQDTKIKMACLELILQTKSYHKTLWEVLFDLLKKDNQNILTCAIQKIFTSLPEESTPFLLQKIENGDTSSKEVIHILKSMQNIVLDHVLEHVTHANTSFAVICIYMIPSLVCSQEDAKKTILHLIQVMDNVDIQISDTCAEVIFQIHHLIEDKQIFIENLTHRHRNVRKLSKRVLIEANSNNKVTPQLIEYFLNGPSNLSYRCAEILEKMGNKALSSLISRVTINVTLKNIHKQKTGRQRIDTDEQIFDIPKEQKNTIERLAQKITSRLKQTNSLNKVTSGIRIGDDIVEKSLPQAKSVIGKNVRLGKKDSSMGEIRTNVFPSSKSKRVEKCKNTSSRQN